MRELRDTGQAFSLTIIGPSGRFLEADGRTAGARAVVWVTDTTIKGLEESSARGKLEEARQVIARDPTAFLDMLGKAPFPAWRVSGMGKLQWVNPSYIEAVDGVNLDRVLDRQIMLDQASADQARKTISEGADIDETRHMVVNGERRAMRVLTFPLSGGAGAMAFDVTAQENAREELNRHVRAHDETLNHVADAVAIFGADRKLTTRPSATCGISMRASCWTARTTGSCWTACASAASCRPVQITPNGGRRSCPTTSILMG